MVQQNPVPPAEWPPRRLVVLVPGFRGRLSTWQPLVERVRSEPSFSDKETQWLPYEHRVHIATTRSLDSIARDLSARIAGEWLAAGGFDEVMLIGHSMGGLIARQCYLVGVGAVPGSERAEWTGKVRRIVLMASVNRGLDSAKHLRNRLFAYMTRIVPFASRLAIAQVLRGSDFLTNLRINWIRHFSALNAKGVAPTVVQLLGTLDSEVAPEDSRDVLAFPDGHYVEVPDADHRTIFRLDLTDAPNVRYALIRKALLGEFPIRAAPGIDKIHRVVFVLHGIRDSNVADWVSQLKSRLIAREGNGLEVLNPTYGYFSAARFALPTVRRKNIRIFQDWYTEALARHPHAQFDVIAHSNGTYLLGHSMLRTSGMRFTNVALVGSVLPQDFWTRFRGELPPQVKRIRNDRANRDWPVALLCNALAGLCMRDVGTAGFAGFLGGGTIEVAYHKGGHSAALANERLDSLVDFTLDGPSASPGNLDANPGFFQQLSNSMPYLAKLLVLVLVVGLVYFVLQDGKFHGDRASAATLGLLLAYITLDII